MQGNSFQFLFIFMVVFHINYNFNYEIRKNIITKHNAVTQLSRILIDKLHVPRSQVPRPRTSENLIEIKFTVKDSSDSTKSNYYTAYPISVSA